MPLAESFPKICTVFAVFENVLNFSRFVRKKNGEGVVVVVIVRVCVCMFFGVALSKIMQWWSGINN